MSPNKPIKIPPKEPDHPESAEKLFEKLREEVLKMRSQIKELRENIRKKKC